MSGRRDAQGGTSSGQFFEKLVDKKQLAELIGMSPQYIDKQMSLGRIPYFKIGRSVRFKVSEVMAWLERMKRP